MKAHLRYLLINLLVVTVSFQANGQNKIFSNQYEAKIQKLLGQMMLEEKVFQLPSQYPNSNVRLGIPNISANECLHGVRMKQATVFPQAIAMASTWDNELIERMGNIVAKETRAYGIHHCFTPMLAVVRDVRWGRTEESFGEDPFLVGSIGAAYINGLQGRGKNRFDNNHIIATAKHYLADGEPMAGANGAAMDISDYTLQNVHLYPFRMAIENARVGSIMPAHHLLNGVPCHGNKHILVDILRNQYKWDGLVVSDNNDIKNMNTTFKLDNIRLQNEKIAIGGKTTLNLTISNTGKMDGEEVVQLYVHDLISELLRPVKELRDFRKVFLKAGESKTLSFEIGPKQLEYWNEKWVVEPGDFEIMVGTNSVELQKLKLIVK